MKATDEKSEPAETSAEVVRPQKRAKTDNEKFKDDLVAALVEKGWIQFGASQSLVLFKVSKDDKVSQDLDKTRISKIHEHTTNVVAPKSYAALRRKQALRWASTIAMRQLSDAGKDPREVQAALHSGTFYMASNTSSANKALKEHVSSGIGTLSSFHGSATGDKSTLSRRERRHARKLKKRVLAATSSQPGRYDDVREALKQPIRFAVGGKEGLHAERRIALEIGPTTLDPSEVGGVKRPCTACYMKLYAGTDVHPGPYWPSLGGNIDVESYEKHNIDALVAEIDKVANTYVTPASGRSKKQKVTHEYDTDSDSDTDSEEEPEEESEQEPEEDFDVKPMETS